MTLEQLRIFVGVAERLHMTQAAAALHITQSAASAAVAALEASTGARLFNRVGRHIELTEAGRLMLAEARAVLARAAAAQQAVDDLAGLHRGHLDLWASQTLASYRLPVLMHRFRIAHPGIGLSLHIGNTAQVATAVLEGRADLGFVEGDTDSELLVRTDVGADQLRLIVAAAPAADQKWTAESLRQLPWVMREPGSGTRALHEQALLVLGLAPQDLVPVLELPSNEAVLTAVLAGAGATILSGLVVDGAIASGRASALPVALPGRRFAVLRHADRYRTAAMAALVAMSEV